MDRGKRARERRAESEKQKKEEEEEERRNASGERAESRRGSGSRSTDRPKGRSHVARASEQLRACITRLSRASNWRTLTDQRKYAGLVEQRLETVFDESGRGAVLVTHFTHCATKPTSAHLGPIAAHTRVYNTLDGTHRARVEINR